MQHSEIDLSSNALKYIRQIHFDILYDNYISTGNPNSVIQINEITNFGCCALETNNLDMMMASENTYHQIRKFIGSILLKLITI